MTKIVFVAPTGMVVEAQTDEDRALIDICDEVTAPVPFSCRATTCGTCGVWVERGEAWLMPPGPEERSLQAKCGRDGRRFACALRVRSGKGVIRLRVCGSSAA
jgi:ferredoxin